MSQPDVVLCGVRRSRPGGAAAVASEIGVGSLAYPSHLTADPALCLDALLDTADHTGPGDDGPGGPAVSLGKP
ncbi:hypothetical protein [Streptomyces violaceorubidus]|uniref:hypothetical protein n=1 Tax=Streptomyces violaceorubidus TaxID=284042 RepID=UPI0012FEA4FC|nr:hypothetical protein [Streptomyces violaceorubidus]